MKLQNAEQLPALLAKSSQQSKIMMTEAGLVRLSLSAKSWAVISPDEHSIKSSHSLSEEPWRRLFAPPQPDQLRYCSFWSSKLKK